MRERIGDWLCYSCHLAQLYTNLHALRSKAGPDYEKWRRNRIRGLRRELERLQADLETPSSSPEAGP